MVGTESAPCAACAECGRATQDRRFRGTHWLCVRHRRALLAKRLRIGGLAPACVTEYDLLRRAVFAFPEACARDEALARIQYVSETWHERDKPRAVLRAHRMGRMSVGAPASPLELLELVTELTAFLIRHARVIAGDELATRALLAVCAGRVAQWYPALVRPAPPLELTRAERIVSLIRRETGRSLFLVKADVVLALQNIPFDVAERIHVAYVQLISSGGEGAIME
jgi:hypothetical protein